jgi:hypothetical protein
MSREQQADSSMQQAKAFLWLVGLALLLGACASSATPAPGPAETLMPTIAAPAMTAAVPVPTAVSLPATPPVQATLVYTRTDAAGYVDTYFVDPNLGDITPPLGGRVLVRARLIKNGVRVGGMMIEVAWMQDGEIQHCQFLPLYQNGCVIEVRDYAPGVLVPVTVTVRYQGAVFMGYGGFTPQ